MLFELNKDEEVKNILNLKGFCSISRIYEDYFIKGPKFG